jgi:hypothetical protein
MNPDRIIQSYGIITKEERVYSLGSRILEDTLVLETKNPFPGYYGKNTPDTDKPRSLYIILDRKYEYLRLARILKQIRLNLKKKCYSSFGSIETGKKDYYCVRLRNLECFEELSHFQNALLEHGIDLMSAREIDSEAIIQIHKSFVLKHLGADLYFKDEMDPGHYYFKISQDLSWERFKEITHSVKNNIDQNIFDAAKVILWTHEGPTDFVRIFELNPTADRLNKIRNRYEYELNL